MRLTSKDGWPGTQALTEAEGWPRAVFRGRRIALL